MHDNKKCIISKLRLISMGGDIYDNGYSDTLRYSLSVHALFRIDKEK